MNIFREASSISPIPEERSMERQTSFSSDGDEEMASDLNVTKTFKFENNKQCIIYGRQIYPKNLECLVKDEGGVNFKDLYLSDVIIDVYLAFLVNEEKIKASVDIFPVEGYLVNFLESDNNSFKTAANYFLKFGLYEKDILFISVCKNEHFVLIVVLKKFNTILCLNSIRSNIVYRNEIFFVMEVLQFVHQQKHISLSENWNLYRPTDLPVQYNSYDCDIITGSSKVLANHQSREINNYRIHIKKQLTDLFYTTTSNFRTFAYDKNIVEKGTAGFKGNIIIKENNQLPHLSGKSLMTSLQFLQSVSVNYWNEDMAGFCHIGAAKCFNIFEEMILCMKCYHWYHHNCIGLQQKPKQLICSTCQDS
ncbi:uncharacterized protein LOC126740341 [Anthonomus grandis grandis]|uniref:uncharacterized protein LOC126740341 n=1 Tax=Anthonomus grandis grandis TaxID=2921223 RepID=UPI0021661896|nr:uncharacterized protein LOC126740341 [Anthonomus grandis grandis]